MTKFIFTSCLDECFDRIEDFSFVRLVDNLEDLVDAKEDALKQLGVIETLYTLHLIENAVYLEYMNMTYMSLVAITNKIKEIAQYRSLDNSWHKKEAL